MIGREMKRFARRAGLLPFHLFSSQSQFTITRSSLQQIYATLRLESMVR